MGKIKWTEENCLEESKKYTTLKDFINNSKRAYRVSLKNGWISNYTWLEKCRNTWTEESVKEISKTCKTFTEFKEKYDKAYRKAKENNWLSSYTWLKKLEYNENETNWLVYVYILGEKYHISPSGSLSFNNGLTIKYKSIDDLYKKLKPYLLDIVVKRVRYYEAKMGISKPYNVKVRDMSSRYGSNVKSSYTVTFALLLVHYSINIIESVIVHELAHDKVYNHSAKFYDVVYKYCPDYDRLHNHLRKKIYHD